MSELRHCPFCHREHEVDDDGTVPTWIVSWTGIEEAPVAPAEHKYSLSETRMVRLKELRAKHPERAHPQPEPEPRQAGYISNYEMCFVHYEDALAEYRHTKRVLQERGDWIRQSEYLVITEGERTSWDELFGENAVWEA